MKIETLKKVLNFLEAFEVSIPATYKHLQNLSDTMQEVKNEIKSAQTIEIKEDLNLLVKNNALTKAKERYQCYVGNTHEKYIKTFLDLEAAIVEKHNS